MKKYLTLGLVIGASFAPAHSVEKQTTGLYADTIQNNSQLAITASGLGTLIRGTDSTNLNLQIECTFADSASIRYTPSSQENNLSFSGSGSHQPQPNIILTTSKEAKSLQTILHSNGVWCSISDIGSNGQNRIQFGSIEFSKDNKWTFNRFSPAIPEVTADTVKSQ